MNVIQSLSSSDFSSIRCSLTWQDNTSPSSPSLGEISVDPTSQEEEYSPECILICLNFDSKLSANIRPPFHRRKDRKTNYDFTVKQRAWAENAKTFQSFDELEKAVSFFQRYICKAY